VEVRLQEHQVDRRDRLPRTHAADQLERGCSRASTVSSNVNPDVDHPRWSQKTERRIAGTGSKLFADRIPTRLFNGYALQVASTCTQGMDLRRWF
jgi:hypothetical protein